MKRNRVAALGPMSQMLTRLILSLFMHIGMYMCVNICMIYLCVYRGSAIKIETAEMKEGRKGSFLFPRCCQQRFNFCYFPQIGKRIVGRICPSSFTQHELQDNCLICFSFSILPALVFFLCCSVWLWGV